MTESAATAPLRYTLTTFPPVLTQAAPDRPSQGRLEIKVFRDPEAVQTTAGCRSITVEVPTGDRPDALTDRPDRIDATYGAPHGRTWHIRKSISHSDRTVFVCTPENPRHEAVFNDTATFTLILDRIPLTGSPSTVGLRITDESATGSETHTRRSTDLRLTVQRAPDGGS
ncbi:hypothetical protein QT196_34975 [Streptomyces sp. P9-2B-2]|uniref:hypothetical protein n=1 Tax=Streptomyces TaxID=1883 RepID=UPI0022520A12|nr:MULTISPECIES: hypothetical protein [Streptomyces]MCX4635661.1 hypothetical protein [Streptomyces platensis]WJY42037.1 hypothetical protein QT196_34975 [Streptomyces sp. P9-2B-2]